MDLKMVFTCDLIIRDNSERYFEWCLMIRAATFSEASGLAEAEMATLDATMRIEELNLQVATNELWNPSWHNGDVYSLKEPREVVKIKPSSTPIEWLKRHLSL